MLGPVHRENWAHGCRKAARTGPDAVLEIHLQHPRLVLLLGRHHLVQLLVDGSHACAEQLVQRRPRQAVVDQRRVENGPEVCRRPHRHRLRHVSEPLQLPVVHGRQALREGPGVLLPHPGGNCASGPTAPFTAALLRLPAEEGSNPSVALALSSLQWRHTVVVGVVDVGA